MKRVKRLPFNRPRRATAGILAAAILFAMLFTVGSSYFLLVNQVNLLYVQGLTTRSNAFQATLTENLAITTLLTSGHIGFYVNNTGTANANITAVFVLDSSGNVLRCDGTGLPGTCSNSTPALPVTVTAARGSATIDTGYTYVSGTDTVRVLTARGGVYSAPYPAVLPSYAKQAQSSGSLTIDLSTFKWIKITGNTNDQQTGALVGGYPGIAVIVSGGCGSPPNEVFRITFTNADPQGRTVTLWPQSSINVVKVRTGSGSGDAQITSFYIVDGLNNANYPTGVTAYNTTQRFINLPMNIPVTLYFGSSQPLGSSLNCLDTNSGSPFEALFTLNGQFSDKTLYAQTIPFPAGVVTGSSATLSAYSGGNSATITASCSPSCNLRANRIAFIGWLDSTNTVTVLTTFTTNGSGNIPSATTFTVPTASAGYYTVVISDYVNSIFFTFNHT